VKPSLWLWRETYGTAEIFLEKEGPGCPRGDARSRVGTEERRGDNQIRRSGSRIIKNFRRALITFDLLYHPPSRTGIRESRCGNLGVSLETDG
jgi:hypothetical protein